MPAATKTIIVPVPMSDFYRTVTDYLAYPDITDEVKSARIISREGPVSIVEFTAKVMFRSFDYRLRMVEEAPNKMAWTFISSNTLTQNRGSWVLEALSPNETRVTYSNELGAKAWIPDSFINALAGVVLPRVLKKWAVYAQSLQTRTAPVGAVARG